jgi:hypothetical protein
MAPPKKKKPTATEVVKEIKRRTRRVFSAEEKIKIVLEGFRGEDSIAAICRKYDPHHADPVRVTGNKIKSLTIITWSVPFLGAC